MWATHEPRIWSFTLWFHSCTSCCCDVGRTWAPYLVIHPVIPLLHFLLLLHGPHMSPISGHSPCDSTPALPAAVTWATHEPRIWSFTLWFHSCTPCCCYMGHTWAPYLVIHPVIPLLHFLLLWRGPHMSQFTCFNVHTWEGGHSQFMETRYLMVIIPEVPNVISGTEIIDFFFFFRKWLWGQEYLLQFPWLSLILHIFFNRK